MSVRDWMQSCVVSPVDRYFYTLCIAYGCPSCHHTSHNLWVMIQAAGKTVTMRNQCLRSKQTWEILKKKFLYTKNDDVCELFDSYNCYSYRSTIWNKNETSIINLLKPNDIYICRTTALTSRRYILNIYSTNIRTEYFKHAA